MLRQKDILLDVLLLFYFDYSWTDRFHCIRILRIIETGMKSACDYVERKPGAKVQTDDAIVHYQIQKNTVIIVYIIFEHGKRLFQDNMRKEL